MSIFTASTTTEAVEAVKTSGIKIPILNLTNSPVYTTDNDNVVIRVHSVISFDTGCIHINVDEIDRYFIQYKPISKINMINVIMIEYILYFVYKFYQNSISDEFINGNKTEHLNMPIVRQVKQDIKQITDMLYKDLDLRIKMVDFT